MHLFYQPDLDGEIVELDHDESNHCTRVLRLQPYEKVGIVDGMGRFCLSEIIDVSGKQCRLRVLERKEKYRPLGYDLHIGIAPTKSQDRFEWFVEKAVEIGISAITPLICSRSERRRIRNDRLEKIVVAAMKQSERAYKPLLNEPMAFSDWLDRSGRSGQDLIAHCMESEKANIWDLPPLDSVGIAIGPEGDFTPEEIELAVEKGAGEISLGSARLRTETAGVVACSAIYLNHMSGATQSAAK